MISPGGIVKIGDDITDNWIFYVEYDIIKFI